MNSFSSSLFAAPSFTEGLSRCLDIGGTLQIYNSSETEEDADRQAILADWAAIGQDIYQTLEAQRDCQTQPEGPCKS